MKSAPDTLENTLLVHPNDPQSNPSRPGNLETPTYTMWLVNPLVFDSGSGATRPVLVALEVASVYPLATSAAQQASCSA